MGLADRCMDGEPVISRKGRSENEALPPNRDLLSNNIMERDTHGVCCADRVRWVMQVRKQGAMLWGDDGLLQSVSANSG